MSRGPAIGSDGLTIEQGFKICWIDTSSGQLPAATVARCQVEAAAVVAEAVGVDRGLVEAARAAHSSGATVLGPSDLLWQGRPGQEASLGSDAPAEDDCDECAICLASTGGLESARHCMLLPPLAPISLRCGHRYPGQNRWI